LYFILILNYLIIDKLTKADFVKKWTKKIMDKLTLTTPALLFSAVSLILLAYTNRFLGYAQLVRNLYEKFKSNPDSILLAQIKNLRKRMYLTKAMQLLGVLSLFLCVVSMFLIYIDLRISAAWMFGFGLLSLIVSLAISAWEIQISVRAIDLHLTDMESSR
jgi:ABC-type phosphate/phosphonate transport system permease subunit